MPGVLLLVMVILAGCSSDAAMAEERARGDWWRTCALIGAAAAFVLGSWVSRKDDT